jgi:type VI secretion system secreted protein VgrG
MKRLCIGASTMEGFMKGLLRAHAAMPDSRHRLIDIQWQGQEQAPTLMPYALRYRDALNHPFQLDALCLADNTEVDIDALRGRPVAFGIDTGSDQRRWLCGIVSAVAALDGQGNFQPLELTIVSALSLLGRRRTCRVFQDQSVPDIVASIIDEHVRKNPAIAASFSFSTLLDRIHPPRSCCVQFNESDRHFIERLLAEEGIT